MERSELLLIVLGTALSLPQDQNGLNKYDNARTPTVMSPLVSQIAKGKQGRCLWGAGCVCYHALRLPPEYFWFLSISPKEIRTEETSKVMSCLPEFKQWQHFLGTTWA